MSKSKEELEVCQYSPLIDHGGYHVLVSHKELDYLVGSLMQMCELTGDTEQRNALKSEIKRRSRRWLDDLYLQAGYESLVGLRDSARPIVITNWYTGNPRLTLLLASSIK